MDCKSNIRLLSLVILLIAVSLGSSGCRSADSPGGLMGVSRLAAPVPSQWEPPVETLSSQGIDEPESAE